METIFSLILGLGLSAACGFRIFVPLFITSLAAISGHLTLANGFEWIGSYTALTVFASATVLEVAAYYVPWLDNFLDTLAAPSAVIAGTVLSAAVFKDMSPIMRWTFAAVAGGGAAAVVQSSTTALRCVSTVTTGGFANPLVASLELGGSTVASVAALFSPVIAAVMLVGIVGTGGYLLVSRSPMNRRH